MVPWAFIALTVSTGMVDAVSFLQLGHVFVANMTGNVVFLGFALAGYRGVSAPGSLVAIGAFLFGSFAGGALIRRSTDKSHLLLMSTAIKFVLGLAALLLAAFVPIAAGTAPGYALTALLGLAMGVQNTAARKIALPDFTTTVLTMTMTGIAADLSSGGDPRFGRRLTSIVAMFAGAAIGAALVLHVDIMAALAVICVLFAVTLALVAITRAKS